MFKPSPQGDHPYQSPEPYRDYAFQRGRPGHSHYPPISHSDSIHINHGGPVNSNFTFSNDPNNNQRGTTNINRSKSLTRPERQRPRAGMINRNPSQPRYDRTLPNLTTQPMSSSLQFQLEQQKQQFQQQQLQQQAVKKDAVEKEPRVLTNWWAWIAYLCTCCFPDYIIRVWFGKSNKNMQQAWREKVCVYINIQLFYL